MLLGPVGIVLDEGFLADGARHRELILRGKLAKGSRILGNEWACTGISYLESIYRLRLNGRVVLVEDQALLKAGVEVGDEVLLAERRGHGSLTALSFPFSFTFFFLIFFLSVLFLPPSSFDFLLRTRTSPI